VANRRLRWKSGATSASYRETALPWNGRPLRCQGMKSVPPVRIDPLTDKVLGCQKIDFPVFFPLLSSQSSWHRVAQNKIAFHCTATILVRYLWRECGKPHLARPTNPPLFSSFVLRYVVCTHHGNLSIWNLVGEIFGVEKLKVASTDCGVSVERCITAVGSS